MCTGRDHKYLVNVRNAGGQVVLHDALRVSDVNREITEVENKSKTDFLGMAISVISKTDRPNKPASIISFYALIRCGVSFYSIYLEKWRRRGLSGKKLIKSIINHRLKFRS
jgi:hypothetical protein